MMEKELDDSKTVSLVIPNDLGNLTDVEEYVVLDFAKEKIIYNKHDFTYSQ